MEQELLILPEHSWLIVEFVNTTGNTNRAGTIIPSGASWFIVEFVNTTGNTNGAGNIILPDHPWFIVDFVSLNSNTTGNTNGAGAINPSGASLVYSRVRGR